MQNNYVMNMFETLEKSQEKQKSIYKYRKIAAILATAALITESPNIIDRMANALTSEQAIRALNDALRIIESIKSSIKSSSSKIKLHETIKDGKPYIEITVASEKPNEPPRSISVPYGFPNESDVTIFIDDVSENVFIARKIGTLASALVVEGLG
jgi:CRISPR type I-A-associated protein Csa5